MVIMLIIMAALGAVIIADDDDAEAAADDKYSDRAAVSAMIPDTLLNQINDNFRVIEPILKNSCYDCHSANTNYPWYHRLPIVGGMMDSHIKEGREHLDFTDGFPFGGEVDQVELLREIREEIEDGKMPLLSYRLMHWGSKIEGAPQDSIFHWIDQTIDLLNHRSTLR